MARLRGVRLPKRSKYSRNACMVLWKTWDNFWRITSISGVSNAGISTSLFRRTCWMILFTFFSVLTTMGLMNVIQDYLAYPVTTSVEIKHQNQVIIFKGHILYTFLCYVTKSNFKLSIYLFCLIDRLSGNNSVQSK